MAEINRINTDSKPDTACTIPTYPSSLRLWNRFKINAAVTPLKRSKACQSALTPDGWAEPAALQSKTVVGHLRRRY